MSKGKGNNGWVVYILKCADNTLYTGITNNIDARIIAHTQGRGAKYTKGRAPLTLIYQEPCESRSEATKRECQIKALPRTKKLALAS